MPKRFCTSDMHEQPDDKSSGHHQVALRAGCSPDRGFSWLAPTFTSVLMRNISYHLIVGALVSGLAVGFVELVSLTHDSASG